MTSAPQSARAAWRGFALRGARDLSRDSGACGICGALGAFADLAPRVARAARSAAAALALSAFALAPAARADDAAAGKAKAAPCAVCHGANGIAVAPDAPNLAGQPAIYLVAQLKAYRGGARKHEVMSVMAKPLTDDDIANLAAWFSSIKVEATLPQ
jgi:cytochrome c553